LSEYTTSKNNKANNSSNQLTLDGHHAQIDFSIVTKLNENG